MATLTTLQYIHMFGRPVAHAILVDDDGKQVFRGTLGSALRYAEENDVEIDNAQDILHRLISVDGYAS